MRLARAHLKSGPGIEAVVRREGTAGKPIPVEHPKGSVTHWFLPVAVGGRLAGYFLFDAGLGFQQYSSFLRGSTRVEGAPDLGSWTDPQRVLQSAAGSAHGRSLGEPYLTYDGVPARLTWAVPLLSDDGASVLFVAGEHVYAEPLDADTTG